MKLRLLKIFLCMTIFATLSACVQTDKNEIRSKQTLNKINSKSSNMKQILIIGMDPGTMDFSKPGFAQGLTAESVLKAILSEKEKLINAGFATDLLFIDPNSINLTAISEKLKSANWDGVLIGYGIRVSPVNFILFEKLINLIHANLPNTKIIFNNDSTATDLFESVQRWL